MQSRSDGRFTFIGTGSIIMPGDVMPKGCLMGAGTVVRGKIPDCSIVVGSPGQIVGDTRDFQREQFDRLKISLPAGLTR